MRNEMQRLRILSEMLGQATDPVEKEKIQEEIWEVEALMELYEGVEYESNHHSQTKFSDF